MMSVAFSFVPETFDVEELILRKHARLFDMGLNCSHFDLVLQHFQSTLQELGVDDEITMDAVQILLPLRQVFAKGVADSEARRRVLRRNKFLYTATVTALGALVVQWMVRRHAGRRHRA